MAELKWLEDLLVLLDESSFTKAAQRRHVTQPAFSRRIRLLEEWLGTPIVDRRRKPIGILESFQQHESEVRDLVDRFYQLRNNVQAHAAHEKKAVFVAQHTLAVSCFPKLISQIKQYLPDTSYRIQTADNEDCESMFLKSANFMLRYDLPETPGNESLPGISKFVLGEDCLIPVTDSHLFKQLEKPVDLPQEPLPLLLFPKGGFFARVLGREVLPKVMRNHRIEVICESTFSVSLKEMVLAGMGIAWLPKALVQQELEQGIMHSLEDQLGSCSLQISLYVKEGEGMEHLSTCFEQLYE